MYSVHCTMYNVLTNLCTALANMPILDGCTGTLYTVQCTLYSVQCTPY